MSIDLSVALRKLHQLQSEDGDLGAAYWLAVAKYLREAETLRKRAEAAEAKLEQIREIIRL